MYETKIRVVGFNKPVLQSYILLKVPVIEPKASDIQVSLSRKK